MPYHLRRNVQTSRRRSQTFATTKLHRSISAGVDGKFRLFTMLSSKQLHDPTEDEQPGIIQPDYPIQVCLHVYSNKEDAEHALVKLPLVEGEWNQ